MKTRKMRCTRCAYKWLSSSKLAKVTCPNCAYTIVDARYLKNQKR